MEYPPRIQTFAQQIREKKIIPDEIPRLEREEVQMCLLQWSHELKERKHESRTTHRTKAA